MRRIRRSLMSLSMLTLIICGILLLNFTAPNPTGRRYSSATPLITGQGSPAQIGISGEQILSIDLNLPRNESSDQRQCMCNHGEQNLANSRCRTCFAFGDLALSSTYRIPDFVGSNFIAESKNRQDLFYSFKDFDQIQDYALGAKAIGFPLWVYMRVDTQIDTQIQTKFYEAVNATGGGVVHYFTVPGHVDPVDQASKMGLAVAGGVFVGASLLELLANRPRRSSPPASSGSDPKPKSPRSPNSPLREAQRKLDAMDDFKDRATDKTRNKLDEQNSRNDFE